MSKAKPNPNVSAVKPHVILLLLAATITACQPDQSPNPVREVFDRTSKVVAAGAALALRFPSRGSEVQLYRLPALEQVSWNFETRGRPTQQILGFAPDANLVYTLVEGEGDSAGFDLLALDLITGRSRTIDTSLAAAALGPTGKAHVVRLNGSVAEVERGRVLLWSDTLDGVTHLWGAARERLLAVTQTDRGRELALLSGGQPQVRQPIPDGPVIVSPWGRLAAIATDSGIGLYLPHEPEQAHTVPLTPSPQLLTMSPSGHKIYAVLGETELVSLGRFGEGVLSRAALPGRAVDLRVDPLGRMLFAQTANADSVWVFDASALTLKGTIAGSWADDLPAAGPDGTIIVRSENRLVAVDPESFEVAATTTERQGDRWFIAGWDARRPVLELEVEAPATGGQAGQIIYVQVSSSGNPAWAEDLAQELRAAGLNTTVLPPDSSEERFRVVLGPYPTREEAEENGRRLGRPFWILTRDTIPQVQ